MQKFNLIFLLFTLLLTSCASHTQMPKTVEIPVPIKCPTPDIPPKPVLPIAQLKPGDKPDVVVKAYVVSVTLLQGYNNELLEILKGFKNS